MSFHPGNSTLEINRPRPWVLVLSPFEDEPFVVFEEDEDLERKIRGDSGGSKGGPEDDRDISGPLLILTGKRLLVKKPRWVRRVMEDDEGDEGGRLEYDRLRKGSSPASRRKQRSRKVATGQVDEDPDLDLRHYYFQTTLKDVNKMVQSPGAQLERADSKTGIDDSSEFLAHTISYVVPYLAEHVTTEKGTHRVSQQQIEALLSDLTGYSRILISLGMFALLAWVVLSTIVSYAFTIFLMSAAVFLLAQFLEATRLVPFSTVAQFQLRLTIPFGLASLFLTAFSGYIMVAQVLTCFYLVYAAWPHYRRERAK